jgi:transcriptional regulator GlxA family with amidase domain
MNELGVAAMLPKPFDITRLRDTVSRALLFDSRRAHAAGGIPDLMAQLQGEHLRIGDIARRMGLSRCGLYRRTLRQEGLSPRECVACLRLETVKALLIGSNKTLEAIAEETGFCSAAYLSRWFSSRTGMSPRDFRARRGE